MKSIKLLGPTLAALASCLLFSTGGLAIKEIDLPALPLAGFRASIAALSLWAYLAWQAGAGSVARLGRYGWIGAGSYLVMTVCFVASTKLTTAANAIFLQYTMPAWVLVGGALWLGEAITFGRCLTIALSLVGMFFFFLGELRPEDWQGNIIALLSGVSFAAVTLAFRKDREHRPLNAVFWGNALTALLIVPMTVIGMPDALSALASARNWLGLLWLGIFQMGLAYIFFVTALKYLPAIEVAILSLIEPVLNPTWVYLFNGETPSAGAILGGALILLSVFSRIFLREELPEAEPETPPATRPRELSLADSPNPDN
ncbi:MAG TPA: EamA family transporter [bacterium]|nr:EamA family transporter [Candidatus Omnitrophota bacterium]HOL93865.1 EamA family transporter [bacterium]HPP00456.1 EamA family transporter [bacterium]